MLTRRDFLTGTCGAVLAGALPGPGRAADRAVTGGLAFGTYWRATLSAGVDVAAVRAAVEAIISSVDADFSPYRADAAITGFNRTPDTGWQPATAPLCEVTADALRIAGLTEGAFDPTIGPLVHRLGFGPITGEPGSHRDIAVADNALRKSRPDLTLDLCGIAKGHALDRIGAALEAALDGPWLVELGGEVMGRGQIWHVGIEHPLPGPERIQRIVALDGSALATSGLRYNSIELGGRLVGHILDPRSGAPLDNAVASVSVIAPSAAQADALATGFMVMGAEAGAELAERLGLPTLFLTHDGGIVSELFAGGFDAYIVA